MNISSIKKRIRGALPNTWESLRGLYWYIRFSIPMIQPQIFNDLDSLLTESEILKTVRNDNQEKILFFSAIQDHIHVVWEFVLAQALKIRGHQVDLIGCDGLMRTSCNSGCYPELKGYKCRSCYVFAKKSRSHAKFNVHWYDKYVNPEIIKNATRLINNLSFDEYRKFEYKGLPVGELVRPSVNHFCRVEDIESFGKDDSITRRIYKDFLSGAVVMTHICERILSLHAPDVVVMMNGLFMPQRIMLELSKRKGIRTVIFECGLMPDTISLLHNHYIDYGKLDGWEKYKAVPLTEQEDNCVSTYISKRKTGEGQTMDYWKKLESNTLNIQNELGITNYKKIVVLFPNVTWDSAYFGLNIMFNNMHEWIQKTILYFSDHPEICLIIRAHPSEATWTHGMRDSVFKWINDTYKEELNHNIKLISSDSSLSSYALMEMSDVGLVYTSTTGLEMALMGKPVVLAARVHYWGRGFTIDPGSEEEYYHVLNRLLFSDDCSKNFTPNIEIAKRYAHFIFFKASIPLKCINSNNFRSIPRLTFSSYADLLPGKDLVLDKICDGITEGKPFVV